ncbi:hypothetical protein [Cohnella rhizosphaerae]|uniref:Uncharacterized protein n=1 Tax=Cohnella rhizosphaerae TaxID=1457232 RepID=A0A9X4QRD7_9BACL|nr:hypothetical protein [Cohnella rhizosphaerae]MDG0808139.1 hypothetical protein [Cohnella rhizosphaerae]
MTEGIKKNDAVKAFQPNAPVDHQRKQQTDDRLEHDRGDRKDRRIADAVHIILVGREDRPVIVEADEANRLGVAVPVRKR